MEPIMISHSARLPLFCFFATSIIFIWSAIRPYDIGTWAMEVAPVMIAVPLLFSTYKKFPLTTLLYLLVTLHGIILMVGGHYTYARVPLFDMLGHDRNNYDKVGHFAQGFIPAIAIRELLLRSSPLRPGKWLAAIIIFACLGISALYEIIEWFAAWILAEGANDFLGSQGDEWDTQKDMAWAGIGAIAALLFLTREHNRALERLKSLRS